MFFAEPGRQETPGPRGKTTRRKSTKTVCGNTGAYCALVKEELLASEPETWVLVTVRTDYTSGIVYETELFRCQTHELAAQRLDEWQARQGKWTEPGCTKTFRITEVRVKWVLMGNGDVRTESNLSN